MNVSDVRMGRWMDGSIADEKVPYGGSWGQRRKQGEQIEWIE